MFCCAYVMAQLSLPLSLTLFPSLSLSLRHFLHTQQQRRETCFETRVAVEENYFHFQSTLDLGTFCACLMQLASSPYSPSRSFARSLSPKKKKSLRTRSSNAFNVDFHAKVCDVSGIFEYFAAIGIRKLNTKFTQSRIRFQLRCQLE